MNDRKIADKILQHFEDRLYAYEDVLDYQLHPGVCYNGLYVAVTVGEYTIWDNQDENHWPDEDLPDKETLAMQIAHAEKILLRMMDGIKRLLEM